MASEKALRRAHEVGVRIRALRTARGLTQDQLAEMAGMERTDITAAETGKLPLGEARLARIAAAFEVSVLELQPEAEADPLGLSMLGRLEALEARVADERRLRDRATRAVARRLVDLEERLELLEQRQAPPATGNTQK